MHVAVFLQYYHTPDCPSGARPYALVNELAKKHDVTVITTRSWEEQRISDRWPWVPSGVRLVRFDVPYENAMSSVERLRAFLTYAARAVAYGLRMSCPDLIIGSSTPLTAAAAAATVATLRNCPWIFEVRDLWPEFPIQMGTIPGWPLQSLLYRLESALYRRASHIVTLSPDMKRHVESVGPPTPVTTIQYGTDLNLAATINKNTTASLGRRLSLDRRFLILYAGTLGRANAIPTLLEAAKQLSNCSDVVFGFAGRGYHESTVRQATQEYDHIRFIDPVPYPEALALYSLADLSLVSFVDRPVLSTNSPSKFYDSLAVGTPVVVTNPGWTKRFIQRYECGWYVPPESPKALAAQLLSLLTTPNRLATASENARDVACLQFDRDEIMDRYACLVNNVEDNASSTER